MTEHKNSFQPAAQNVVNKAHELSEQGLKTPWHRPLRELRLLNLKSLFFILVAYVSLYVPILNIWNESLSLSEWAHTSQLDLGIYPAMLILSAIAFALGAHKWLSKGLLIVTIIAFGGIFIELFNAVKGIMDLMGANIGSIFDSAAASNINFLEFIHPGFIFFIVATAGLLSPLLKKSTTNSRLWTQLRHVVMG